MTEAEFQQIWIDVRDAIVTLITANVPAGTKVVARDTFDDNGATWLGRLADTSGQTHCWSVFYDGTAALDDPQNGVATEQFQANFRIAGFHYYNYGTNASNSTDTFMAEINKLRFAFMNLATLDVDIVESHTGFIDNTKLGHIDGRPVHIAKVELGVRLQPIPYDYQ